MVSPPFVIEIFPQYVPLEASTIERLSSVNGKLPETREKVITSIIIILSPMRKAQAVAGLAESDFRVFWVKQLLTGSVKELRLKSSH
jgi:hypothetical protein